MPIIGNLRTTRSYDESGTLKARPLGYLEPSRSQAYVETPQHRLTDWIIKCGGPKKPLGRVPSGLRVGIIGGGSSGVTAALEAVKAGATTTLIEARSEVGGRARSAKMGSKVDSKDIGELGCMRFPPSEAALYGLAEAFDYGFTNNFPDPGLVPTLVCYGGESQLWTNNSKPPEGFKTVTDGWNALVKDRFFINGKEFASPTQMTKLLQSIDPKTRIQVQKKWQVYIDEFKNDTFLHGLKKIFSTSNDTPPGGKNWTDGDVDRFGKLGVGSGGLGAFFNAGFLTTLRCVLNSWETDQSSFVKLVPDGRPEPAGIRDLWQSILDWSKDEEKKEKHLGTLTTLLNTKAIAVSKSGDSIYTVTVETPPYGRIEHHEFDELFINVTTNVANFDLDLARKGDGQIFPDATCDAISTLHMALTTKLFIKVRRTPYFNDRDFPRALLTDGDLPQLYCLDYGDNDTIVVLVVYSWEDYSARLQAEKDPKKLFKHLKELAARAVSKSEYPKWADCLEPVDDDIRLIHWQDDPYARGAFTFALPGQDILCRDLFYDFEKGEGPYLIGDSYSFGGGWIESGLETTYTCFSAMLKRREESSSGELYNPELAPVNLLNSKTYTY